METVKEHCKHADCRYRGYFDAQPACMYMLITGSPRNCKISECDKFRTGKVKIISTISGLEYKDED